jgi:hypothetical protein
MSPLGDGMPVLYTLILKRCNACNPQTSIIPAYPDAEFPMVSCRIDSVCQVVLFNNHSSCQKRNIKFFSIIRTKYVVVD